ncbi:MAG: thioredoxin [Candidatus Nezhaarchaeota archaeon]|nr:thioredoxin [Candidatus Nezhaarchaeota archaeon]
MNDGEDVELERLKAKKIKELLSPRKEGPSGVIHADSESFRELLEKETRPVLVDFWAEWCAPCRMLAPIIEGLAKKYSGRVVFAKLNVDENPGVAAQYGIMAIPTLILFVGGVEVDRIVGLVPEKRIEAMIEGKLKEGS